MKTCSNVAIARICSLFLALTAGTIGCGDGTNTSTSSTGSGGSGGGHECVPTDEICDGIDNDCDGQVDEDLGENTCGVGACVRFAEACVNGSAGACVPGNPTAEICDGIDNDCDDQVDEDLGTMTCGVGACAVTVEACVNGSPSPCMPGTPTDEICDGFDNDCDDAVDEDLGTLSCGVGACAVTVDACTNGVAGTCVPLGPTPEVCNGIDDDCNGTADDGNPGSDANCDTGMPGICSAGTTSCTGGAIVCNAMAMPMEETCNGLDDDCNGVIDDAPVDAGNGCSTGLSGACATGTSVCMNGMLSCTPDVMPVPEMCGNAMDDDCDGTVDEAFEPSWEVRISNSMTSTLTLDIVAAGNEYAVLYYEYTSTSPNNYVLYMQRVSNTGTLLGGPIALSSPNGFTQVARMAWNGSEYGVVMWTYDVWPDDAVKFQRVSATGALIGAAIDIDPNPSAQPNIVWNGTDYAITWMSRVTSQMFFERRTATGTLVTGPTSLGMGHSIGEMAWTGTQYGITWDLYDFNIGQNTGYFTRVAANGTETGTEIITTPTPVSGTGCCGITGLFDIAWNGTSFGILRRGVNDRPTFIPVSANGVLGTSKILFDEPSIYPSILWTGTEYVAEYQWFLKPLVLARLDASGNVRAKSTINYSSIAQGTLAWDGTNLAAAWYDNRYGNYEVSMARFANACE